MIFLIAEDVNLPAVIVSCLDVTGPNLGHQERNIFTT